jgi:hypothetical protein
MLLIDGRRLKVLFLIIGLGDHDVILGRKWASHLEVLIDCKNRSLKWPAHRPARKHYSKVIATSKAALLPAKRSSKLNKQHQRDADRRDAIMTLDSWRPRILKRGKSSSDSEEPSAAPKVPPSILQPKLPIAAIDIVQIGVAAFRTNLRRKENVLFQASLYDIEREIQYRAESESPLSPDDQQIGETELE